MTKTDAEQHESAKPAWSWRRKLAWGSAGLAVFAAVVIGGSYWYASSLSPEEVLARVDKPAEVAEAGGNEEPAGNENVGESTDPVTAPGGSGAEEGDQQSTTTPSADEQHTTTENSVDADTTSETTVPPTQESAQPESPAASGEQNPNPSAKPVQPEQPEQPSNSAAKGRIDAKYDGQLQALQNSCTGKMQALVGQIVGELKGDSDLQKIQSSYMGKISEAESGCDGQFQSIMSQAQADYKQAGISTSEMPGWQSAYESAKNSARASALSSILGAASE
ncbi:hypothetical protein [Paenibacillus daejeonensis]|uniref:hypothetical protein n=1 Tax=Paenibacillus daejeonensis TaxID=135193 RepID=UPI000379DCBC|nr:hypothetical protein [Paenibacillus daejeonensis]